MWRQMENLIAELSENFPHNQDGCDGELEGKEEVLRVGYSAGESWGCFTGKRKKATVTCNKCGAIKSKWSSFQSQ